MLLPSYIGEPRNCLNGPLCWENISASIFFSSRKHIGTMSLTDEFKTIEPRYFEKVAKKLARENNYSDYDLSAKYADLRQKYLIYNLICKKIENNGERLLEESMIHAVGLEHMLRTLIVIGEEASDIKGYRK
jgi:hypothetical protein